MSNRRAGNQLALFVEAPGQAPAPRIRPWRATLADSWTGTAPTDSALEEGTCDLLRRNRAFLRAMDIHVDEAESVTGRFGPEQPRHRKERERTISGRLREAGTLRRLVAEALSDEERALVSYLLDRDGEAPFNTVSRRFGSDRDDGWFWDELPPASVLGRLRLHCLAFVGTAAASSNARTVVVPRELRKGVEEALAAAGGRTDGAQAGGISDADDEGAAGLSPALASALDEAFPGGIIAPVWYDEGLDEIHEELRTALRKLADAELLYERALEEDEGPWLRPMGGDPDAEGEMSFEAVGWDETERSYALFFLSPRGDEFQFPIEGDIIDGNGRVLPTTGVGRVGWVVALSGVAPFALLRVASLDTEEHLGTSYPDIERRTFDEDGTIVDAESVFREMIGGEARERLDGLRRRIEEVLAPPGIAVLSSDELARPVPWLEADEEVLLGTVSGAPLTVEDALFFLYA